jgi:hypothetical protein
MFAQPPAPNVEWSRTYGGDSSDSQISGILPLPDGGYMLCGSFMPNDGNFAWKFFLVRTNGTGDCVWSRTYGSDHSSEACLAAQATADGGFVLAGPGWSDTTSGHDFMLLKTDAQGDCLSSHTYGRDRYDACYSVQPTSDGGYLLAGASEGIPYSCGWMVKTDADGDSLWSRLYGGANSGFECVQETSDQNLVLTGTVSEDQLWVMLVDQSGDSIWSRAYTGGSVGRGESVRQTDDGGFVLGGWIYRGGYSWDIWMVKTDGTGDSTWSRTYGTENGRERCHEVIITGDGGYLLVGDTTPDTVWAFDGLVVRTNASGDSLWSIRFAGAGDEVFTTGLQTADGGFLCGGYTAEGVHFSNALLVKLSPELIAAERPVVQSLGLLSNYPNPFNTTTHLEFTLPSTQRVALRLYDVLGREVAVLMNEIQTAGQHRVTFDASGLPSGVYLCRLEAGEMMQTRKMALIR